MAMLADAAGYSVALGAFLAGALVAEADADHAIAPLIEPIRDLFAAIFFVSVGMLIDPAAIAAHWIEIVVVLAVVVGGKIVAVSLGVFVSGRGIPAAITTGMTMAQIGELSFVAASIGVTAGVLPPAWYAVAVAVSAVSTALTPLLVRLGPRAATWVEPRLPRRLSTFAALYGSWIESASARPARGPVRRRVTLLGLDAAALLGVVLGFALARDPAAAALVEQFGLDADVAALLVVVAAVALAAPLLLGMTRLSHALAVAVAERALPARAGLDLGAAPRRMLTVAVQLPILVVAAVPGLAAAGAIAPSLTAAVIAALVAFETWRVWRSAGDLDEHVRAGAQAIVEVLAAATPRRPRAATEPPPPEEVAEANALSAIETVLPGLGTPTAVRVTAASALVGKTLAATNLRGATGATVLAIQRGATSIPVPAPTDEILVDDVLALAGSSEAIAAATALLAPPAA
jgi:CPA2 family monovalent cation:H+ antiporter-2